MAEIPMLAAQWIGAIGRVSVSLFLIDLLVDDVFDRIQ
jgi:hypothetical protein